MCVLLVTLLVLPAVAPFPSAVAAAPSPVRPTLPSGVRALLDAWLVPDSTPESPPTDAAGLLALILSGDPASAPDDDRDGWTRYFHASGLSPTSAEAAVLRQFVLSNPALSTLLEGLAGEVAAARVARDAIFGVHDEEERARLASAVASLVAGEPLRPDDARILASVDVEPLVASAARILAAVDQIQAELPQALELDARARASLPVPLMDAALARDVERILREAGGGATPVSSGATYEEALAALAILSGVASPDARTPPDYLQQPLSDLLAALARQGEGASGDLVVATLAATLPALTRAGHNLSLEAPGTLQALAGAPRPLHGLRSDDLHQGMLAIQDTLGGWSPPAAATLAEGTERLHAAHGASLSPAQRASLEDLEETLGPDLAAALGTLLAAQAAYAVDLAPGAPVVARAAAASESASRLLASGEPLSLDEVEALREHAHAILALRALTAARAGPVVEAVESLRLAQTRSSSSGAIGVLYEDELIVVTGLDANHVSLEARRVPPVLLLDLGGDDLYTAPVGGVDASDNRVGLPASAAVARTSVAIDLGGNDTYRMTLNHTLGAARGVGGSPALGVLMDASGHDVYRASHAAFGFAEDGIGLLIDAFGSDSYEVDGSGFAVANATPDVGVSIAAFVDVHGHDRYRAKEGFVNLTGAPGSLATLAMFLDVRGNDTYERPCPKAPDAPCFATPREDGFRTDGCFTDSGCDTAINRTSASPLGTMVFIDVSGADSYPRPQDPHPRSGYDGRRAYYVANTSPLGGFDLLLPSDFDLTPEGVLAAVDAAADDDGDGYPNAVEALLGTDPNDAVSRPITVPPPPSPIPRPSELIAGGNDSLLEGSNRNLLVDIPGARVGTVVLPGLAIGLPGRTEYRQWYALTLDLGLGDPSSDVGVTDLVAPDRGDLYLNATAWNGYAIDLGGDDLYAPEAIGGEPQPMASTIAIQMPTIGQFLLSSAVLVDLGGNDKYLAGRQSLAHAHRQGALALLLDADGNDLYRAGNQSQGYSTGGHAYFLDLGGNDAHRAPTQGVVNSVLNAAVALFVDAGGADEYPCGVPFPDGTPDSHQGASWGPNTMPAVAFVDADGHDKYVLCLEGGAKSDVSAQRNNDMRLRPWDDRRRGAIALRYDANATANADGDGFTDATETVAGTNATDRDDGPWSGSINDHSGFALHLPRLGIAVGATTRTTYDRDYAILVDLEGSDLYLNRAGASDRMNPVAVAVDLGGGDDEYLFRGNLTLPATAIYNLSGVSAPSNYDVGFGAAQGAGILGIGVLVDAGGSNTFDATAYHASCDGCAATPAAVGAAQGAGVLGVGLLVVRGDGDNRFNATAESVASVREGTGRPALARTHAQGAAIAGVGILAVEGATGDDAYGLSALARSVTPTEATTGQGYASRGVGVLLDSGGANRFDARHLAQGAADDDDGVADPTRGPLPLAHSLRYATGSVGALLLPGRGDDELYAETQSQAYAGVGGLALLIDMEGDDLRKLLAPQGKPAAGQAHARTAGLALLLDNRGNDRYQAAGTHAQASARQGVAILADLGGSDAYEAGSIAQGVVEGVLETAATSPAVGLGTPAAAVLFDRAGNDVYALLDLRPRGQGSAIAPTFIPVGATPPVVGVALFLDAGGGDFYVGSPEGQKSAAAGNALPLPKGRPEDGNDWGWIVEAKADDARRFVGLGLDTGEITRAYAYLDQQMQPAGGARLEARDQAGNAIQGSLQGVVKLTSWLGVGNGTSERPAPGSAIDRVEFYIDGVFFGRGDRAGDVHTFTWRTDEAEGGLPRFPDGHHEVEAWVYPRAGTPTAGNAAPPQLSYGAAVDGEPARIRLPFAVDNPPARRGPEIGTHVALPDDLLSIRLRVDRDLERGGGACPACDGSLRVEAGPDEWGLPLAPDPFGPAQQETSCTAPECLPGLQVTSSGGQSYLSWTAPEREASRVVGYRVLRSVGGAPAEQIGFVDPRAPLRLRDEPDANAGDLVQYQLQTLRKDTSGVLRQGVVSRTVLLGGGPAAPTGLVAMGAEGGVALAWNPVEGATDYVVLRGLPGEPLVDVHFPTGTRQVDPVPVETDGDRTFAYAVVARTGQTRSAPSSLVLAAATPGNNVTITLQGVMASHEVFDGPLGGAQRHDLRLRVPNASAPDGDYFLNTTFTDAAGRNSTPDLRLVVLDRVAPVTTSLLPPRISGSDVASGRLRVPFEVVEAGLSASRTMAFTLGGPCAAGCGPVPSAQGYIDLPTPSDGSSLTLRLLSQDAAGNVEGLVTPYPWRPTLLDAARDPQATPSWRTHVVDLKPPTVEAEPFARVVRPGVVVEFNASAADAGSGIAAAYALIGEDQVPLTQQDVGRFVGRWTARGEGLSQIRGYFVDAAGNQASLVLGVVRVDPQPPLLQDVQVSFTGERTIGRAGDLATLRVVATDNGTEEGLLVVSADLSSVSSRGNVTIPWEGRGATYVLRDFPVDRLGATEARNATVRVTDLAGNVREANVTVHVDGRRIAASLPHVRDVGATGITVNWSTGSLARARVDYGPSPQFGLRSNVGETGQNHTIRLEGLQPATTYFARAVSISPSGIESLSDTFTFTTLDGLLVQVLGGVPTHARGTLPLSVRVLRHDGTPAAAMVDVLLQGPRGSPRIVATASTVAGLASVEAEVGGLRDGEYLLTLVARTDEMRGATEAAAITLDRVAPAVQLRSRAALAVGGELLLDVEEAGSGVDLQNATATIGGVACSLSLNASALSCRVPSLARDSKEAKVLLRVPDRAGNVALVETRLGVDADAPRLRNATIAASGGISSVRPGEQAFVRVVVEDVTLRNVTADVSSLGGPQRLPLRPEGDGWHAAAFTVAPDLDGEQVATIRALDAAGRTAAVDVRVTVDGTPPLASRLQADAEGATSARVSVLANEPVTVVARAPGIAGEALAGAPVPRTHHQLLLTDLVPGKPFRALVTLRDAAGHETTVAVEGQTNPDLVPPSAIKGLVVEDLGDGAVSLHWDPASDDVGVSRYRVVRMDASGNAHSDEVRSTSWSGRVEPGAELTFTVIAVDLGGNEGVATGATLTTAAVPHLREGRVDPPIGGPGFYAFEVLVTLRQPRAPDVWVEVDGVRHPMQSNATDCRTECAYRAVVFVGPETLDGGPHVFSFGARNEDFSTRFPEGAPIVGPAILGSSAPPDVSGLAAASPIPAVGAWVLLGSAAIAAAAIATWKRFGRKSGR